MKKKSTTKHDIDCATEFRVGFRKIGETEKGVDRDVGKKCWLSRVLRDIRDVERMARVEKLASMR